MPKTSRAADDAAEKTAARFKGQLVHEVTRAMKRRKMTQSELARQMRTSRAVVHRLLKPADPSVTLSTMARAFAALGCTVKVRVIITAPS